MKYWFIQSTVVCSLKIALFIKKRKQVKKNMNTLLWGPWIYLRKVKHKLRSMDVFKKQPNRLGHQQNRVSWDKDEAQLDSDCSCTSECSGASVESPADGGLALGLVHPRIVRGAQPPLSLDFWV